MTDGTEPTIDTLKANILTEFKQVLKLAPADYTENCTNVVMSLVDEYIADQVAKARIDELRKIRIKQFDSSQGDYELGWNELRHELRCHIKDRLAQLKNNTTKQETI